MEELWQSEFSGDVRACDVHISNLRQKVERDPQEPGAGAHGPRRRLQARRGLSARATQSTRLGRRAGVAQLVEHFTRNEGVSGSSPHRRLSMHLSNHHRNTLEQLFDHQASGNVEWRNVRSLLEAVGPGRPGARPASSRSRSAPRPRSCTSPQRQGHRPARTIVDLRRMLSQAGLEPGSPGATPDERGPATTATRARASPPRTTEPSAEDLDQQHPGVGDGAADRGGDPAPRSSRGRRRSRPRSRSRRRSAESSPGR